jgi:hypothetical protein
MSQDPDEFAHKHLTYDKASNTLLCQFRGLQILTGADVALVGTALERTLAAAAGKDGASRVHVVVDYRDAAIASGAVEEEYAARVAALQDRYYLSVRRFGVSSFGTQVGRSAAAAKTTQLG